MLKYNLRDIQIELSINDEINNKWLIDLLYRNGKPFQCLKSLGFVLEK